MHPLVLINRKRPALNWEKRFFWKGYNERELSKAIRLASGREMGGRYKGNAFIWRCVRKRLVAHYQSLYGEVPTSFKKHRLSNIMEIAKTIEYKRWMNRDNKSLPNPSINTDWRDKAAPAGYVKRSASYFCALKSWPL